MSLHTQLKDVEGYPQDEEALHPKSKTCEDAQWARGFNRANAQHKTFQESVEVDMENIEQEIARFESDLAIAIKVYGRWGKEARLVRKTLATAIASGLRYRRKG